MSFVFNGITFANYGIEVLDGFELPGATTISLHATGLPAAPRVWFSQGDSAAAVVEFPVRIQAATPAALILALDAINAALYTTTDAVLTYYYTDRHWLARWDGAALKCTVLNTTTLITRIRFLAQPNMLATADSTGSVAIASNPQTFYMPGPLVGSGVVAGNATTAPRITFTNAGAEIAANGFMLWNATTGGFIDYTDTIPTGTAVVFDCESRRVYVGGVEVYGKVTSDWLTIKGGAAATMTAIGCAAGTIAWTYRARYL